MSTGDRNAFGLLGEQFKSTNPGANDRARLAALRGYLRGLPGLDFTEKGRANICARHHVSPAELAAAVAGLQGRPGRPTAALLASIGAAVAPATGQRPPTMKGAGPC